MNSSARRIITAATRPLGDNHELLAQAEAELGQAIADHGADGDTLEKIADALERDAHKALWLRRLLLLLPALAFSIVIPVLIRTVPGVIQSVNYVRSATGFGGGAISTLDQSNLPITAEDERLLFPDPDAPPSKIWERLWKSQPANPTYLAEHAKTYFNVEKSFSAEITSSVAEIDGDNGFYDALLSSRGLDKTIKKSSSRWMINDAAALDESIRLIHRAAEKSEFRSYGREISHARLVAYPAQRDLLGVVRRFHYASSFTANDVIAMRRVADAISAEAQRCAERNDRASFRRLVGTWVALSERLSADGWSLVHQLIVRVFIEAPLPHFRDAAKTLGLNEEAERFQELEHRAQADRKARSANADFTVIEKLVKERAGMISSLTRPMVARQANQVVPVTKQDLAPERFAEHALAERLAATVASVLMILGSALVVLSIWFQSRLAKGLAEGLDGLISGPQQLAATVAGVALPLSLYFGVTRFTDLSAREWNILATHGIQLSGQVACTLLAIGLLPSAILSAMLGKNGAAVGLAARFALLGWVGAGAALAGIVAFGGIPLAPWLRVPAITLAGIAILRVAAAGLMVFAGSRRQILHRTIVARRTWPVLLSAALVLALLTFLSYHEERACVAQMAPRTADHGYPELYAYEARVVEQVRKEREGVLSAIPGRKQE